MLQRGKKYTTWGFASELVPYRGFRMFGVRTYSIVRFSWLMVRFGFRNVRFAHQCLNPEQTSAPATQQKVLRFFSLLKTKEVLYVGPSTRSPSVIAFTVQSQGMQLIIWIWVREMEKLNEVLEFVSIGACAITLLYCYWTKVFPVCSCFCCQQGQCPSHLSVN